jgi:hypothetical protein
LQKENACDTLMIGSVSMTLKYASESL